MEILAGIDIDNHPIIPTLSVAACPQVQAMRSKRKRKSWPELSRVTPGVLARCFKPCRGSAQCARRCLAKFIIVLSLGGLLAD